MTLRRPTLFAAALLLILAACLSVTPRADAKRLWVDPARGSDARSGASPARALRTLDRAWRIARPGTRITVTNSLQVSQVPNYYELKRGVTIEGLGRRVARGRRAAVSLPALNIYGVRSLSLIGLTVRGDVHCEKCRGFTMRRIRVLGRGRVQEGVKINQSSRVLIERSDISGASDNSIDFVAVQHATIRYNRIHHAEDWCAYAKGGSAYVNVYGNRIYRCGTGGFTAGQGTGLQFMTFPWIRYEAYGVRVWNNLIHDTEGAGLGVNGAFNVLMARNTLLRVGQRSHALEAVFGSRSCDGRPGDEGRDGCQSYLTRGAWGTTVVDDGTNYARIPNRHVFFIDNVILKAPGSETISTQEPWPEQPAGAVGPQPARTDDDLRLLGNVVSTTRRGSGGAHTLPAFDWADAGLGAPAPSRLGHSGLPGMPRRAGSSLR